jgi:hypothetical protein
MKRTTPPTNGIPTTSPRLAYGLEEAALALSVPRSTIERAIAPNRDGPPLLKSFNVGKRKLISHRELERFVASGEKSGFVDVTRLGHPPQTGLHMRERFAAYRKSRVAVRGDSK